MDRETIQRILQGETASFEKLVVKYQGLIFYSILKMVGGNREEAEDLTQEVFLSAYRSLAHFREEASFSTWLMKIAVNKTLDHKRKKQLTLVKDQRRLHAVAGGDDPLGELIRRENKETVHRLIAMLSEEDRRVIMDYYYHELSYKEIALKEKVRVKTVESKLYRARQRLKKLLEEGHP